MKQCICCGEQINSAALMVLERMPALVQNLPEEKNLHEDEGMKLSLLQCDSCGLVQFDCDAVYYYRDVIRSGGNSTTMRNLRHMQYQHLISRYGLEGKRIVEVGCGQGEFLDVLKDFPVEVCGIEHNAELVEKARSKGLCVSQGFTEHEQDVIPGAPFDAFLSFNFIEHQPYPNVMLRCIYNNLVKGGIGLVTVPSLEYILDNKAYYELMRDHIAYYTNDTLRFLFEKNGFEVLEQEMINRDTISMIVRKRQKMDVSSLQDNYIQLGEQVGKYLDGKVEKGQKVAIWGASHQGFTIAATLNLDERIEYIIDSAPFKQGKFSPSSHIPIVSPSYALENPVNAIIVIAPGYTEEIVKIIREKYKDVEIAAIKDHQMEIYN